MQEEKKISTSNDSSSSDILEFAVQNYSVITYTSTSDDDDNANDDDNADDDDNDNDDNNDDEKNYYWEHDDNINKSQNNSEIAELRKWAVTCNVPLAHLEKLLGILRKTFTTTSQECSYIFKYFTSYI